MRLVGATPVRQDANIRMDPYCAKQPLAQESEVVVGPQGGLKNVVVRVVKGPIGTFPVSPIEATVDQQSCAYKPRVQVVQTGQTVSIKNRDQTLHNVHAYKGSITLSNQAQPSGTPPLEKTYQHVGDVIKLKCDVHPWMTAYLIVTDNPFFATSDDQGRFVIENLPPGNYTVEAWHERFGTRQLRVTVAAGQVAETTFELPAKD